MISWVESEINGKNAIYYVQDLKPGETREYDFVIVPFERRNNPEFDPINTTDASCCPRI